MRYAYFLGCITPLRYPGIEAATKIVLRELGVDVIELDGASCCPAPGVFGSFDLWNWLILAARNLDLAEDLDANIVVTCNGCYGSLQEAHHLLEDRARREAVNEVLAKIGRKYEGKTEVKHVTEVLLEDAGPEELKKRIKKPLKGLKVAVHYGCHYLKPSKVRRHGSPEAPTYLDELVELTGAESIDYLDKLMCCGAGGGVRAGRLDVALDFTLEKVCNIRRAGGDVIVTPCAFCHFQFDTGQRELMDRGLLDDPVPVAFITQLIGLAMGFTPEELGLTENFIPPKFLESIS